MSQSVQCLMCARYEGAGTCEAFPRDIPIKIFTGEHDHALPYPGDHGLRFKAHPPDYGEEKPTRISGRED